MIIAKLNGGIGNQMFQYAAGKSLALLNNCELKLDITHYDTLVLPNGLPYRGFDLSIFNFEPIIATEKDLKLFKKDPAPVSTRVLRKLKSIIQPYSVLYEPHFHFYPELLTKKGNILIDGYWQSEKYFKGIENVIRDNFKIKTTLIAEGVDLLKKIKNENSVCLNIRRKEFASNLYINQFTGLDYINNAVELMTLKLDNPHFFIFSDELSWVKQNLKIPHQHTFVEDNLYGDRYRDCLFLMTSCKHFIIPNSTFGWWGAWLSENKNKIVIAPDKWLNDVTKDTTDLIPESWIRL